MDNEIVGNTDFSSSSQIYNKIDVYEEMNKRVTYSGNLGVEIVATTKDKISNALHDSLPKYEMRRAWIGPAGLFATLVMTLFTAEFKDVAGISGQAIMGACVFAAIICVYFTVKYLFGLRGAFNHAKVVESIVQTADDE